MKKITYLIIPALFLLACGSGNSSNESQKPDLVKKAETVDTGLGEKEIKHVDLNNPLNPEMVKTGTAIYDMKCSACHKLTDQRVVGPGWSGLTTKRKPEWIMNMVLNIDVMLEKDPEARELLKQCLVRMPNQNLSLEDARSVLEYMYANDGGTVGQ